MWERYVVMRVQTCQHPKVVAVVGFSPGASRFSYSTITLSNYMNKFQNNDLQWW